MKDDDDEVLGAIRETADDLEDFGRELLGASSDSGKSSDEEDSDD